MTDDAGRVEYIGLNGGERRCKRHIATFSQRPATDIETLAAAGGAANGDAAQQ